MSRQTAVHTRDNLTTETPLFRIIFLIKNRSVLDYLKHLLPLDTQLDEPGSQLALDLFARCSVRHVDLDEDLLHGLVPAAPGGLAGDHPAPLLEVHWHAAVPLAARLAQH